MTVAPRPVALAAGALGLGILAQLLFFDAGLGINFPIAIAALLVATVLAAGPAARRIRLAEAWLPVAAVVLASMVALRADRTLVALDVLGSLFLAAGSVLALGGLRLVDRPLGVLLALALRLAAAAAAGANAVLGAALRQLPARPLRDGLGPWAAIIRGILIALPLVVVFVALFSGADAVFARWTERLLDWDLDLGSIVGRSLMALVVAWLAAGTLAFAARPGHHEAGSSLVTAWSRRPRLGSVEAVTVLVALDIVFAAFVLLQAAYLFGGLDTLAETGLTYAEYARRGFFELLAVAFLVGSLVLGAESFVRSRSGVYRVTLIGLVVLTLVVLASAFLRLRLYQDAYGWTELRFYVLAAISWLAAGAIGAVGTIVANRSAWLLHGMLALSVVFGLAFNAIGPVRFVADRNVDRGLAGERLDLAYLIGLGSDAVPAVIRSLNDRPLPPNVWQRHVDLMATASGLDDPRHDAWQAWNLSREHARTLLDR